MKVFLTGASSGLGWALAEEFARRARHHPPVSPSNAASHDGSASEYASPLAPDEGAQRAAQSTRSPDATGATHAAVPDRTVLALVARRADLLDEFAHTHPHVQLVPYVLDVTDTEALRDAAEDFTTRFGLPDIVIANAGISQGSVTGMGDLDAFARVMAVNYLGMVATFEPFVSPMRLARSGTLVGIASVAGVRGLPGAGAYSASKAAALRYLESLRVECRRAGVAVVTIAPGYIRTPMTDGNPYPMPFLMAPDAFARGAVDAILKKRRFTVLPWPMRLVAMVLHILPRWLYDAAFARAPHKPRVPR
ncbi:NAD(P)-dependent dehydrogenase (short-subunit alcohol dehydrogenase family) [Robbsia andropogonis]|uniref:SDR family oxidoreductase n=1 Tax=Robbsia andropogonis TaxID=28092 RepID=UPI003D1BC471